MKFDFKGIPVVAGKLVRLRKLEDRADALHALNTREGFSVSGIMVREPAVGESFILESPKRYFTTSVVQEVMEGGKFKTLNSVYIIEDV